MKSVGCVCIKGCSCPPCTPALRCASGGCSQPSRGLGVPGSGGRRKGVRENIGGNVTCPSELMGRPALVECCLFLCSEARSCSLPALRLQGAAWLLLPIWPFPAVESPAASVQLYCRAQKRCRSFSAGGGNHPRGYHTQIPSQNKSFCLALGCWEQPGSS